MAALVGQKREGDAVLFSETGQYLHTVVADGEDRHVGRLRVPIGLLQLHELPFAVRSPTCAAIENDKRAAIVTLGVEVQYTACLIGQANIGKA